jgi:hypothetical protein
MGFSTGARYLGLVVGRLGDFVPLSNVPGGGSKIGPRTVNSLEAIGAFRV